MWQKDLLFTFLIVNLKHSDGNLIGNMNFRFTFLIVNLKPDIDEIFFPTHSEFTFLIVNLKPPYIASKKALASYLHSL